MVPRFIEIGIIIYSWEYAFGRNQMIFPEARIDNIVLLTSSTTEQ